MKNVYHIGDADGLIAILSKNDAHHKTAVAIVTKIISQGEEILFPSTAVVEAITTLQVRLENPQLAKQAAEQVLNGALSIIPVDAEILGLAAQLYKPEGSKKHTMFDATVAATAQKYGTKTIFSFDKWYKTKSLTLLSDQIYTI